MSEPDRSRVFRADQGQGAARGWSAARVTLLAALVLAACAIAVFADLLFADRPLIASAGIGDTARYFVFSRPFAMEEMWNGNVPLWNPHSFGGTPLVGVFQTSIFYPLNLPYLFLPISAAVNLEFLLHVALGGMFVFVWLRGWGLHPIAALYAGVMVAFGAASFLRVLAGQLTVLDTIAWAPLLLASIDRLAKRASLGWTLAGIAAATMMILAGHPPTLFMIALSAALYCIPTLVWSGDRRRLVLSLAPILVVPFFLAAVQLWTGLAVAAQGVRAGGMSYDFATSFSFPPESLLSVLVPNAFGDSHQFRHSYFGRWFYWDASAYVGAVGFVLALYGAVRGRLRERRMCLVLVALLTLLALGRYTPLYQIPYTLVPGFDSLRAPSKFMFSATLFAAALAALGLDRLISEPSSNRAAARLAGGCALLLGALALWVWLVPTPGSRVGSLSGLLASFNELRVFEPGDFRRWSGVLLASLLQSTAVVCSVALLLRWPRRRSVGLGLIVLIGVGELLFFAHANHGGVRPVVAYLRRPGLAETYRRAGQDRVLLAGVTSNIAIDQRGYDLWGYDSMMLGRYLRFMAFTQDRDVSELNNIGGNPPDRFHPLFSMLRGRYLVGRSGEVEEHPDPLPRFLMLRRYRVLEDADELLSAMGSPTFDPRLLAILEEDPQPPPFDGPLAQDERAEVRLLDESTDHLTLEVELDHAAILVITDSYARDWRAVALPGSDATEYRLIPANYVLRAVPLGAGSHRLRVEYDPLAYRAGVWASGLSGAAYTVACVVWLRRRLSRPRVWQGRR